MSSEMRHDVIQAGIAVGLLIAPLIIIATTIALGNLLGIPEWFARRARTKRIRARVMEV